MNYRDFGKTGIKVSEVGFGSWAIGGNAHGISYGPTCDRESLQAIDVALDKGCNFFDTADVYGWGHSEELLGQKLKSKRRNVVIATKVGSDFYQGYGFQSFGREYIRFAFNKSIARLKTDYIDVYQLHNPPLEVIESEETLAVLKELKREGKIRSWGLSVATCEEAKAVLRNTKPDSLQIPINIFASDFVQTVLPQAGKQGCAIIAREPLANGFLSGKYGPFQTFSSGDIRHNWPLDYINARVQAADQLRFLALEGRRSMAQAAIKWVLNYEEVSVAIAGVKTEFQAEENFLSGDCPDFTIEEKRKVEQLQSRKFGL